MVKNKKEVQPSKKEEEESAEAWIRAVSLVWEEAAEVGQQSQEMLVQGLKMRAATWLSPKLPARSKELILQPMQMP